MARVYATRADLLAYPPPPTVTVPADPEASRLLTRASEAIDEALVTAIYDTDPVGMPTDPMVRVALRDATCAQVLHILATGDEDGAAGEWDQVVIGNVKLSGRRSALRPDGRVPLAAGAERHLRLARLLPGVIVRR
ncbi:hypothetical protein LX15_004801 [Streptoalloteichus tenebrarius]|uniref:DUF3168 domain-containing protein n=1 Tax=Streptoalloteichus tenebrarius (strain ATCC 17920 / DSM 40477 / JCM 4838 / CBS 697.72 / NBRC 16177 / NCIMB 11028 / NRRL B-12390 / A12253. 1 / ISP 5477) TaxID=1933 RepID=A0ABT1HZX0_STRSD|nr:hypothetical protein [Streptoalloteichus tenebrarius]MCP2261081.1 hypothetical protein [Streptoalloteichus tenebrarius]BFF03124.1 hypothetical protein GCM10020241_47990 [Streptoalloteichus tenebrarius]